MEKRQMKTYIKDGNVKCPKLAYTDFPLGVCRNCEYHIEELADTIKCDYAHLYDFPENEKRTKTLQEAGQEAADAVRELVYAIATELKLFLFLGWLTRKLK